ncbi:M4 family metallopeptidase [Cytobacillus purgationiresistens]|uniref:M4 family metallopeptidase n=1 Tax=Cytobacillus purgationiresistens TaxID=863449 RepID=UPI0027D8BFF4|nr:M4 family metallopeptidase [Cytobacillus purgationiresistens]
MKTKVISTAFALSIALGALGGEASAESYKINFHDDYSTPSYIIENWKAPAGLSKKEAAIAYLTKNSGKFKMMKAEAAESFKIKEEINDKETGTHHFKVDQLYKGIPVYGADQTLSLSSNNEVTSFFGKVVPNLDGEKINTKVSITKKEAIEITKAGIETEIGEVSSYDGELKLEPFIYEHNGSFYSTYLVTASTSNPEVGFWHYFIDTATGEVIDSFNAAHEVTAFGHGVFGGKQMFEASFIDGLFRLHDQTRGQGVITYDYDNNINEDVTSVSKMFRDGAAIDAHANSQKTYDYFKGTFGRNSVDNRGQRLLSRVHVGENWNNASWNGVYMSYGDGDGMRFHSLAGGLDVAAHEMSHGVIQHTANLIYRNESGALNESFADIFGAMVDRENWIIGEDIMANGAIGLRSLEDPAVLIENRTQAPYPDHWDRRYTGTLDSGGVHINSSINNKAAYLVSEGGEHYGVQVTGVGREATEQIYYRALSTYLTSSSNFAMMRQAAIQAATDLYGSNSDAVNAVKQAYNSVGVY